MLHRERMIRDQLLASARLKKDMADSLVATIDEAVQAVIRALDSGGKVLLCGNGGSAADCQHIAAELVGRFRRERRGLPAVALTTDTSVLTSIGNDYGYRTVFERQVEALGSKGDVLIGFSTSAGSENIVSAMNKARHSGLKTIAFIGSTEGPVAQAADIVLRVPSEQTARIQEGHITIGHILCDLVEAHFCGDNAES